MVWNAIHHDGIITTDSSRRIHRDGFIATDSSRRNHRDALCRRTAYASYLDMLCRTPPINAATAARAVIAWRYTS